MQLEQRLGTGLAAYCAYLFTAAVFRSGSVLLKPSANLGFSAASCQGVQALADAIAGESRCVSNW